ncbi:MAG TPA: hypothetical protein ENG15_06345, partial [Thermotoga sp.]|nr:hypothetical protein [Thermotoga sp.]
MLCMEMKISLLKPTKDNFKEFGEVVEKLEEPAATASEYHDYWHDLADLSSMGDEPTLGYLKVYRKDRPLELDRMERHVNTAEVFIPINGTGIFFLCPPMEKPDINKVKAFLVDRSCALSLHPGTWHWLPFSLTEEMDFILVLRKTTVERDIEIVSLGDVYKINLV